MNSLKGVIQSMDTKEYLILAINPGSTSTKIGVYRNETKLFHETLEHSADELAKYASAADQYDMREAAVLASLKSHGIEPKQLAAVVARGAPLPPVQGGAYTVNQTMIDVIHSERVTEHASLVAAPIALAMATPLGIPALIYDAVSTNELTDIAKISGLADVERPSQGHALNAKAMARRVAHKQGKTYESMTSIVAHMGGGISITLHKGGRMIDIVSDDEGMFSPERAGAIPIRVLIKMCYSGKYDYKTLRKRFFGQGGLVSYLGTNNVQEVEARVEAGDTHAKLILDAMIYQIAKGIGQLATVVDGQVDAIILTGGIAYSDYITQGLSKRVSFIAPVCIEPGENELEALAMGGLRVLRGEETAKEYMG